MTCVEGVHLGSNHIARSFFKINETSPVIITKIRQVKDPTCSQSCGVAKLHCEQK